MTATAEKPSKPAKKPLTAKQKKQRQIMYGAGGVAVLAALITWWAMQPRMATIEMGVCRTFAELQVPYPQSLVVNDVERFGREYRIYYTYMGGFGETRSEMMACWFMNDPKTKGMIFEKVELNRKPFDQSKVASFNKTIPFVIAAKPSLVLPNINGDLLDLKRN